MPATLSLEESASPQARAPEISDLGRPPVHRFTTAARICLGHQGITCAGDDGQEARRHILCGPGSDRCAGHGGKETVRIECTGVPSAALVRRRALWKSRCHRSRRRWPDSRCACTVRSPSMILRGVQESRKRTSGKRSSCPACL
ncbi:unnamed protein product [Trichogramma brassicae]|uniref:Uncharacterized protein n=1 Tax=Trichogramma brassicae TaxID=86971 RepID=A0A6H5IPV6_9HYME|nr:unnamed protein product [Trichogramma brassicae]